MATVRRGRDRPQGGPNFQRSTLNAQRSTLNAQRSTLNAQRSTLNAQRSTLNAQGPGSVPTIDNAHHPVGAAARTIVNYRD